ncbi:Protein of unknown function [Pyronema omphalodes CBS 100304]|uniref:Uncharacterized protein n=1 Tax=Pyronema omphalodes (strain CBS 100304) TaxID=1076935 RepID=U4LAW7_PYROM|nr:Protein of unknown function [Pyronema omphalodes CBS 100304]
MHLGDIFETLFSKARVTTTTGHAGPLSAESGYESVCVYLIIPTTPNVLAPGLQSERHSAWRG